MTAFLFRNYTDSLLTKHRMFCYIGGGKEKDMMDLRKSVKNVVSGIERNERRITTIIIDEIFAVLSASECLRFNS